MWHHVCLQCSCGRRWACEPGAGHCCQHTGTWCHCSLPWWRPHCCVCAPSHPACPMPSSRLWSAFSVIAVSHHITSHHITPHHITSHHTSSHHITSHLITSHHITSHHPLTCACRAVCRGGRHRCIGPLCAFPLCSVTLSDCFAAVVVPADTSQTHAHFAYCAPLTTSAAGEGATAWYGGQKVWQHTNQSPHRHMAALYHHCCVLACTATGGRPHPRVVYDRPWAA